MHRYRHRIARFIVKWRTEMSVGTVLLYLLVLVPASIVLFPDSTLWLAALIILVGFLDEVKDLADQLSDQGDTCICHQGPT